MQTPPFNGGLYKLEGDARETIEFEEMHDRRKLAGWGLQECSMIISLPRLVIQWERKEVRYDIIPGLDALAEYEKFFVWKIEKLARMKLMLNIARVPISPSVSLNKMPMNGIRARAQLRMREDAELIAHRRQVFTVSTIHRMVGGGFPNLIELTLSFIPRSV